MSDIETQVPGNEDEADSLLESIEAPSENEVGEIQTEKTAAPVDEYVLTVGGKEIKGTRDQVLKWAQMGYDAPNRIGELNKALESYKSKEQQFKEWEAKYGVVDKHVRENPEWWQHVQSQWEQRQNQNRNPDDPVMSKLSMLESRLGELSSYKDNVEAERQQRIAQQEDAAYMQELESVKKQYPKVDLSTPDESGKSLEYKVIEYANQNGIKKFTTAFRDFYHDELLKLKEEEAKEKVMNDKQSRTKLGILGISSTPTKRTTDSVKGKSYGDLEREALEELGIAR